MRPIQRNSSKLIDFTLSNSSICKRIYVRLFDGTAIHRSFTLNEYVADDFDM